MDAILQLNQPAPDFTLRNQYNAPITLSQIDAQFIVIFTFTKACGDICTAQALALADMNDAIKVQGGIILGIGTESPSILKEWHNAHHFPFDLLSDPDHAVLSAYDAWESFTFKGHTHESPIRTYAIVDRQRTLLSFEKRITIDMCIRGISRALNLSVA